MISLKYINDKVVKVIPIPVYVLERKLVKEGMSGRKTTIIVFVVHVTKTIGFKYENILLQNLEIILFTSLYEDGVISWQILSMTSEKQRKMKNRKIIRER